MAEENGFDFDEFQSLSGTIVSDEVSGGEISEPGDLVEPQEEPSSEPEVLPTSTPEPEPVQESPSARDAEFDYSLPLNPREQALIARLEQITGERLEQTSPAASTQSAGFEPQEINFLDGVDLDDAFSSPENFNKLLLNVYNKGLETASTLAAENVMRSLPATISQYVTQHLETKAMVDDFYVKNADLSAVKRTVAAVANEISAQHPEYTLQQVFDEAATKTRQVLNLREQKSASKGAPVRRTGVLPGQNNNSGGGRRNRYVDVQLDGLAKEVHDLLIEQ